MRRTKSPTASRRVHRTAVRRRRLVLALVLGFVAVLLLQAAGRGGPNLTPFQARVVTLADGQLGYSTQPTTSYCNRFSAYWHAGAMTCPSGERSEEWCADFAAWVWRQAGARFSYGFGPGEIDAAAGSFYTWAVAHHRWHPVGSGYIPKPGDVALYGLDPATGTASHVAVVTSFTLGDAGPNVVNGDGDRTGFSVVESGTNQFRADLKGPAGTLGGYASPIEPSSRSAHSAATSSMSSSRLPNGSSV